MFNLIYRLRGSGNARKGPPLGLALALPLLLSLCVSEATFASGGAGGGFSGNSGGNNPRQVDEVYEYGKSLYLGRSGASKKINYCVKVDGEPKKLRGRTLRPFRGSNQVDFANALYDCDNPDQRALLSLKKEEVAYVLYYLNKRYRLGLST